jgi:hypothetical protein
MILFIFCIWHLIGIAQLIIIINKIREKWIAATLPWSSSKPIIVRIAMLIRFLAFAPLAVLVWPLWAGITDEHIDKLIEKERKKLIDNDQL